MVDSDPLASHVRVAYVKFHPSFLPRLTESGLFHKEDDSRRSADMESQ